MSIYSCYKREIIKYVTIIYHETFAPRFLDKVKTIIASTGEIAAATDLSMVAADIYRDFVVWDEVGISTRGDCAGATNILRAETGLPGDASPK